MKTNESSWTIGTLYSNISEVLNYLLNYLVIVIAHKGFKAIVLILYQDHRLIR